MSIVDEETLNQLLESSNDDHDRLMERMDRARIRMHAQMAEEQQSHSQPTPSPPPAPNHITHELPDRENKTAQPTPPDLPEDIMDTITRRKQELNIT